MKSWRRTHGQSDLPYNCRRRNLTWIKEKTVTSSLNTKLRGAGAAPDNNHARRIGY